MTSGISAHHQDQNYSRFLSGHPQPKRPGAIACASSTTYKHYGHHAKVVKWQADRLAAIISLLKQATDWALLVINVNLVLNPSCGGSKGLTGNGKWFSFMWLEGLMFWSLHRLGVKILKTKAKKASIIMIENFIQSPKSWARGFRKITKRSKTISKCNFRGWICKSYKAYLVHRSYFVK